MHVLRALGLEHAINGVASAPRSIEIADGLTGRMLTSVTLGRDIEHRFGAPYLVVHRGDLQAVLLSAIRNEPRIRLRLGTRADTELETKADWIVAADGVNSDLRRFVRPGSEGVRRTAYVAWRGTIDTRELPTTLPQASTGLRLGPDAHFVHYPMRSGLETNLVAIARTDNVETLRSVFHAWAEPVRDVLARTDWRAWPITSVDPMGDWVRDRTVLIGDAAHAMWPYAAQGGAAAIEDGWTLVRALEGNASGSILRWQSERQRRVAGIARIAERNRWIYHLSGPLRLARNAVMRHAPTAMLTSRLDPIYGWKPRPVG